MTFELAPETPRRSKGGARRRITIGKITGQKPALKMKEVWSIRARLELRRRVRDLALFNLAIDSKLRGCDLVRLRVEDVWAGGEAKTRGSSIRRRRGAPSSSRSRSRRELRSTP
jgi:hypothetical protein